MARGGREGVQQAVSAILAVLVFLVLVGMAGFMLMDALSPGSAEAILQGTQPTRPGAVHLPAQWTATSESPSLPATSNPTSALSAAATAARTPSPPSGSDLPGNSSINGQIVFVSTRSGFGDLYLISAGRASQTRIFLDPLQQADPRLSPGGELVVFQSRPSGSSQRVGQVRISDLEGTLGFLLQASARDASWSPDGDQLAMVRGSDIILVDADASGSLLFLSDSAGGIGLPVWAPSGDEIAFARQEGDAVALYLAEIPSGETSLVAVMPQFVEIVSLDWSPDGERFLLCVRDRAASLAIYQLLYGGTGLEELVPDACWGSWSPDGEFFVFAADRAGNFDLYLASADGTVVEQLTDDPSDDYQPDWGPGGSTP